MSATKLRRLRGSSGPSCSGLGEVAHAVSVDGERPRPLAMRPDPGAKVRWYRTPLPRETLNELNRRSDFKGFAQTLGYLGLLTLSGGLAWYSSANWPWPLTLLLLFAHGTFYGFTVNGFHELCHRTVFRTRAINEFFVQVFAFLGMHNTAYFRASHLLHHQFTLHPPDDLEVILPLTFSHSCFLKVAFVNPQALWYRLKSLWRWSRGRLGSDYERDVLFTTALRRRALFRQARFTLGGHLLIALVSLASGQWMPVLLLTLANFYGQWLLFLCNNTQHVGLMDNVADYRLCTRTFIPNRFIRFLYWHMNWHIEHHMYAGVPCYNLSRLHAAIRHDLPPCPRGLVATWREIVAIMQRQLREPEYQFVPPLPTAGGADALRPAPGLP